MNVSFMKKYRMDIHKLREPQRTIKYILALWEYAQSQVVYE